ncbi:MAG: SUF system NifU family Fe-S cluster assembly protein [Planctomycetota bacterium]|nr:SUF system NifU family Fe-S cluster assembly protein [Planctomycetota bacterium]
MTQHQADDLQDLDDLYQQVILDHGRRPRNFRALEKADGKAEGFNPLCGDRVTIEVKLEGDRVADAAFTGKGCAICTASASMLTQAVKGKPIAEARRLFEEFHHLLTDAAAQDGEEERLGKLVVFAGVRKYPIRVKCATLPWHTFKVALEDGGKVTTE